MSDIVERLKTETPNAVRRLIKGAWRRDGERLSYDECPRFGIPARPDYDDDLTVPRDIAEAADEITRLRAEIDELRDPKLSHMRFENGCLDMALVSPVIEGLATALGGWFIAGGAKNYAEMRLHDRHETGQVYIVTVQKSGAKTPHELRAEAEAEVTRLRAEVKRKDAALRAIADQSGCGCTPVCHCNDNVGALLIFKEWAVETARAALTEQEKTDADNNS